MIIPFNLSSNLLEAYSSRSNTIKPMAQLSRRVFLLMISALAPAAVKQVAEAATKKPSPTPKKKVTPSPTSKKVTPSPTPKKATPTPSTSSTSSRSPSTQPSQSKNVEGVVIAKSSELSLRQTKIFYLKDSFGISIGYSLTRTSRGIAAFDVKCTHNGVPCGLSGMNLKCPAHGSIFDPETGEAIRGPAVEPLKSYRTIESDGEIRIVIS